LDIREVMKKTVENKASDLHITVGLPPMMRLNGLLKPLEDNKLDNEATKKMAYDILSEGQSQRLEEAGEVDFSYVLPSLGRFRVNIYKQRGNYSTAIRVISIKIPSIEELGFPDCIKGLAANPRGLILVTGPTGSGKSTTLASMINHINESSNCHILTLEEPIEYLHNHKKSMINQREIGQDSQNFVNALRAALREDPDVILVGEMRDLETISTAITAAETGHLVMSTLHTTGAAQTIDRIIDVFPPHQQQQIKVQLSSVLQGVISQQLLPTLDGKGRVAALEILIVNDAIRNLVREGKTHQILTAIQTGIRSGMRTMDYSLSELVKKNRITREEAMLNCVDPEMLKRYMNM